MSGLIQALRGSTRRWKFTVLGDAKGQPRQRHFARKIGDTWKARSFDPGTAEGWKSLIAVAAKETGLAGKGLEGPVRLFMRCHFSRPKSQFRTGKNSHLLRESAPKYHTGKPDLDNIVKAAKDTFTQIGVWRDDSQVCQELLEKTYVDPGTTAFTEFEISEVA